MTADILPFGSIEHIRRIKELEGQLGEAHDALLRAKEMLLVLKEEQDYRKFYQALATERLHNIADLERKLNG
jgi:hypothetical protein